MSVLKSTSITLLDGALGSELERRGIELPLPLWSAYALIHFPDSVFELHKEYVLSGCDVLTAATFRTSPYTFKKVGLSVDEAFFYTKRAIDLARSATFQSNKEVFVAGSIGPLEDCYHPELTPPNAVLVTEHSLHIQHLYESGCDLLLIETMPTLREAIIAAEIALRYPLPVWISMQTNSDGTAFFDGSPPQSIFQLFKFSKLPELISVNCSNLSAQFQMLSILSNFSIPTYLGCYPNVGKFETTSQWSFQNQYNSSEFIHYFRQLLKAVPRVRMIGGCCGSTPILISHLRQAIDQGILT